MSMMHTMMPLPADVMLYAGEQRRKKEAAAERCHEAETRSAKHEPFHVRDEDPRHGYFFLHADSAHAFAALFLLFLLPLIPNTKDTRQALARHAMPRERCWLRDAALRRRDIGFSFTLFAVRSLIIARCRLAPLFAQSHRSSAYYTSLMLIASADILLARRSTCP